MAEQLVMFVMSTEQHAKVHREKPPTRKLTVIQEQPKLTVPEAKPPPRSECVGAARPCQWFSCRYHLWVNERRPGRRWQGREHIPGVDHRARIGEHGEVSYAESCALDVAAVAPDGLPRMAVGKLLGISNERVRQIEESALAKLGAVAERVGIR